MKKFLKQVTLLMVITFLLSGFASMLVSLVFWNEEILNENGEVPISVLQSIEGNNEENIKKAKEENITVEECVENIFIKYDTDSSKGLSKKEFKKYAKQQNITVNSIINKIMKEYEEWGEKIPAINMIQITAT